MNDSSMPTSLNRPAGHGTSGAAVMLDALVEHLEGPGHELEEAERTPARQGRRIEEKGQ